MGDRNPLIDILRIVFAFVVVYHHMRPQTICGYLAVDFFFIVSGYLLIARCRAKQAVGEDEGTFRFCLHKYLSFLPYLVVAEIALAAVYGGIQFNVGEWGKGSEYIVRSILNMTCLSMAGLFESDVTWYLSAMMMSYVVLYPLMRHGGDFVCRYVVPVISVLSMVVVMSSGQINVPGEHTPFLLCKGFFRGLADMGFGIAAYTFVEKTGERGYTGRDRLYLTLLGVLCYGSVAVAILFYDPGSGYRALVESAAVFLLTVAVAVSMSGEGLVCRALRKVPLLMDNCERVALLSLLVYLNHSAVVHLVRHSTGHWQFDTGDMVLAVVGTLVMCVVCYYLGKVIDRFVRGFVEGVKG